MGKQGHQSQSQESDYFDLKIKEINTFWTSWKIGKLKGQYPKVVLCDIANNGVSLSQDCSYNLPDIFKTKVIRCFKLKMRAVYRFEPSCLKYNTHKNENEAAAKNRQCCPSVQSERSICPSWRGTEHQRQCTDAQTFPRPTTCSFPQELTSEGSAACSASFSAGEQLHMVGGCVADMGHRGIGEDFRPGFPLTGSDDLTEKRVKLSDNVKEGTLSSTPDFSRNAAAVGSSCGDREETCSWVTNESQSCAKYALGNSTSLGVARNENRFCKEIKPCEALTASEMFAQNNNGEMDEPEFFTCQRVQAYVKKIAFSCARTDIPWPFSNRMQNTALHAVKPVCPAGLIDPPDNSEHPQIRNEPDTFRNSTNDSLSDAPKCFFSNPALHDPEQNHGKQDDKRGEGSKMQNIRKNHENLSMCSLESTNVEPVPHLIVTERSHGGSASDGTDLSAITTSASLPDSTPQTGSAASTPPPSVLGQNDWGSATTLSSLSSPATIPALSFQQKEPTSVDLADVSLPSCVVRIVEMPPFHSEKSQRICAAPFSPSHSTDSSESCDSLLLLPQDINEHRVELTDAAPPELEPYFHTSPIQPSRTEDKLSECVLRTNGCQDTAFTLPPILSPVSSPRVASKGGPLAPCQSCSDEEERIQTATCRHIKSNTCDVSKIVNTTYETSTDNTEEVLPGSKRVSARFTRPVSPRESGPFVRNCEDFDRNAEQKQSDGETSEDDIPNPGVRTAHPAEFLRERRSSSSSNDDGSRAAGLSLLASSPGGETKQTNTKAVSDLWQGVLDEFSAYERDILLIGVTQDDPELFENVPQESLINLGPTRSWETTQTTAPLPRSHGASSALVQRLVLRCGLSLTDCVFPSKYNHCVICVSGCPQSILITSATALITQV